MLDINEVYGAHDALDTLNDIAGYIESHRYTPVWERYLLTIEEASSYYHIGENKLRDMININPMADFYLTNGNRTLIKRTKFEQYLDKATSI